MRPTEAQLRALLDRYEAAATTVAEERQLRAALAAPDLPEALHPYRAWFGGLDALATAAPTQRPGPWSAPATDLAPAADDAPPRAPREATIRTLATTSTAQRGRRRRALFLRLAAAAAFIGFIGLGVHLLIGGDAPAPAEPRSARRPGFASGSPEATATRPGLAPAPPEATAIRPGPAPAPPEATAIRPGLASAPPEATAIDWSKYEVTDPDEAARLTRAALAEVSTRLRRGSALTAVELGRLEPLHHLHNSKS